MAKNLMIQGTMSGAGKSILTAGILRVLYQDGYRVAPFKSQNMALNSCVTIEGKEIGRAQALQAFAAHLQPGADMNPILLKPMGDTTSQVIVAGEPVSNMRAADYFKIKKDFIPDILKAYDRLAKDSDIIVIEGAGSPVEINLRENDIVNMGLAELLDAPVLLAGNIDPGGVFAQLLGTVSLMPKEEKDRIKGLIINKFRGDVKLLEPGLDMFKAYCDIPFAGVVPYVKLQLDEEDSVSERLKVSAGFSSDASIKIAVVRLPYISNYTDFTIFDKAQDVEVIYADSAQALEKADLIILPGTKNTMGDIKWLKETGLFTKIRELAASGKMVIGICGGFQMLGKLIEDEIGAEKKGSEEGFSLLPVTTAFCSEKTLKQVEGSIEGAEGIYERLNGCSIKGYEIHMGKSSYQAKGQPMDDHKKFVITNGNVLGSYVHGIFDSKDFAEKILDIVGERKGLPKKIYGLESKSDIQERELDKLADVLRDSLDWKLIYNAIGL